MVFRSNVPFRDRRYSTGWPGVKGSVMGLCDPICPGDCSKGAGDIGPAPFRPLVICGRAAGILLNSVPSSLAPFHCPFPCGRFRGAALGQAPKSLAVGCAAAPFIWPLLLLTAVEVDETDEFDEIEEDELFRGMVLRGIKTPRTSSEFMELRDWAPLSPHADRLIFAKLGGLATAVMRKDWRKHAKSVVEWLKRVAAT